VEVAAVVEAAAGKGAVKAAVWVKAAVAV